MTIEMQEAEQKRAQVMEMIGHVHEQRRLQACPTKAEVLCQGFELEEFVK